MTAGPTGRTPDHSHRRDWRPCPWTGPGPFIPTRPYARFLVAWAEAVLHEETFTAFVQAWSDAGGRPAVVEIGAPR